MGQTFACHYCEGEIPFAGNKPGGRATCPHCGVQADVPAQPQSTGSAYEPPRKRPPHPQQGNQEVADAANMALLFGILGLLVCQILGPIAIMKGNQAKACAYDAGIQVPGAATAGLVLGYLATILVVVWVGGFCLIFGLAGLSSL